MVPRFAVIFGLVIGNILGIALIPQTVKAVSQSVLISEVQVAGSASGHSSDEFIELYNAGDQPVSLEKWQIKYHALATGDCSTSWVSKFTFGKTEIQPHGYWLLAANGYLSFADGRYAAGLASSGGSVKLFDANSAPVDALAWGSNNVCGEGVSAGSLPDSKSFERRPGDDVPEGGNSIDTDDNFSDFLLKQFPEPQSSLSAPEEPSVDQPLATAQYLPLRINELVVDPVSPATDANDEFIEIVNPNTEAVQVAGYVVKTTTGSYHLLPQVLQPGEYLVLAAQVTHLQLSNNGGSVSLLDPLGSEIDVSAPWNSAVAGAAWALFDDGWTWTATPSPAGNNIRDDISQGTSDTATSDVTHKDYLPVKLSELYPDPAAPLTDANDEFIELYNPNDQELNLMGYVIKTGTNLGNTFVMPEIIVPANGYVAITGASSPIALSNSGSTVAIFDPNGVQLDVAVYSEAPTGQVWIFADDAWMWSTTPTPNSANIVTLPAPIVAKTTNAKVKTAKSAKKTVKLASAKKTTAKKEAAAKTGAVLGATSQPNTNPWLLFILAGFTICYIIYEFRYDIRNIYHQLKGDPSTRGQTGKST